MFHVFLKILIVILSKEIDKNYLLSLSIEIEMYVVYFVKTLIVTLFK